MKRRRNTPRPGRPANPARAAAIQAFLEELLRGLESAAHAVHERQFELQEYADGLTRTRDYLDDLAAEIRRVMPSATEIEEHGGPGWRRLAKPGRRTARRAPGKPAARKALACAGRIVFHWAADGNCRVDIDFASVEFSDKYAKLLEITSQADLPREKDGLPAFQSRRAVLARLNAWWTGKPLDRQALTKLVWRVKDKLEAAGLSRDLLESEPKAGLRFRLKEGPP